VNVFFFQTECKITPIVFQTIMFRSGCSSIRTPPAPLHLAAAAIPRRAPCPVPHRAVPSSHAVPTLPRCAHPPPHRGASAIAVPHKEDRGHRNAKPQQGGDVALKAYVANVCFKSYIYFKDMLQVFYMDVATVDQDIAYVSSASEVCCKRLLKMFHLF